MLNIEILVDVARHGGPFQAFKMSFAALDGVRLVATLAVKKVMFVKLVDKWRNLHATFSRILPILILFLKMLIGIWSAVNSSRSAPISVFHFDVLGILLAFL